MESLQTIYLSEFILWGDVVGKLLKVHVALQILEVITRKKKKHSILHRLQITQIYVADFFLNLICSSYHL